MMPNTFQGNRDAADGRFAIVVSRFNESITKRLLDGAVQTLTTHGVADDRIDVAWTPGAFEIPTVANRMAASGRYVAVICLGAVIRGETTHDQQINRAVSMALCEIGVRYGLPVLFGLLTCNTLDQAIARSGGPMARTAACPPAAAKAASGATSQPTAAKAVGGTVAQPVTTGKDVAVPHLGNKGVDCALAALEMVDLLAKLPGK
ncbi:MAG: 6,7-dimethyl-8-ribityllumazine synthase [Thermoguttaceae bacterium]